MLATKGRMDGGKIINDNATEKGFSIFHLDVVPVSTVEVRGMFEAGNLFKMTLTFSLKSKVVIAK